KTIELTLSGDLPDGWAFGSRTTHTVTLQDDDLAIFFANAPSTLAETESDDMHTITVRITQAPTAGTDLVVRVAAGGTEAGTTADPGNDFGLSPVDLTFNASNLTRTFTINILEDSVPEPDEFIVLTLADMGTQMAREREGFSLGGNHRITIPANDNTVAFASGTSTLTEGANTMTNVAVNVNQPAPVPITLNVDVIGTTDPKAATEGTDYENLPDSLTIGARQSSGTITLRGREDELSEGNENIMLEISVPSGSSLPSGWALGSQTTHMVTLQDNDLVVGFAEARQVIEESSGVTTKSVPITINQAPSSTIEFDVIVTGEGEDTIAMTTGSAGDYVVAINAVSFPAQQTGNRNVTVNINNDNDAELEERVVLTLREKNNSLTNSGFSLGQATHTIVIPPNDNTVSLASTSGATLGEEGGTATVTVNVNKVAPSDISLTVTGTGVAIAGTDYTLPGTLTINAGQSSGEITLTGMTDTLREGSEGFTLTFAGNLPDGWGFVNTSGTSVMSLTHEMTLVDDDLVTGFVSSTSMAAAPASFGTFPRHDIQVSLPSSPAVAVTLTASKTGGNAVVGGVNDVRFDKDSVTFPANATGSDLTQIISIAILDPGAAGKTLEITLMDSGTTLTSGSNNFTLDSPTHTVTITSP
ncbi:MAG: hypothetical protein OXF09_04185, partial [Hyphomicrobiales bacterium]|nr:hypothetical protein [Hyphomicrobiales bacterium]